MQEFSNYRDIPIMLNTFDDYEQHSRPSSISDARQGRTLVDAEHVEIETPFEVTEQEKLAILRKLRKHGFALSTSDPVSVYMDAHAYPIARRALMSLRLRDKGISSDGEIYPAVMCMKSRNLPLQAVSNEITASHPLSKSHAVTPPLIRTEIEVPFDLKNATALSFNKVPDIIAREICARIPLDEARSMIMQRRFVTYVPDRLKAKLYFDPDQKEGLPFHSKPLPHMASSGRYICLEIAFDNCRFVSLPDNTSPSVIKAGSKNGFKGFRNLGQPVIFEPEFKKEHSGFNITDAMIIAASLELEVTVRGWLTEYHSKKPRGRYKIKRPHLILPPRPSKFAIGMVKQLPADEVKEFLRLAP